MDAANSVCDAPGYGDDNWTKRASDLIRQTFETDCDVYFVFTGTAANSLALATLCQSYNSVICHETSHIETSECGAPVFFSNGAKLLLASGPGGKMVPAAVETLAQPRTGLNRPKPSALSITQSTELGTVYTTAEVTELSTIAHRAGLRVHMDGARLGNAVASLGCSPAELTWKSGIDVLCFGGTKTGMMACEAVLFFDRSLSKDFAFRCKQAGQVASKMRYLTAQWIGMLEGDAWLKHAAHANAMARQLASRLRELHSEVPHSINVLFPVQSNGVFVTIDPTVLKGLRHLGWELSTLVGDSVRLMCSWEAEQNDIDHFMDDIGGLINANLNRTVMRECQS